MMILMVIKVTMMMRIRQFEYLETAEDLIKHFYDRQRILLDLETGN
jgi:hypothetical protein